MTDRNDPCPCGSGKKFKKCHGINSVKGPKVLRVHVGNTPRNVSAKEHNLVWQQLNGLAVAAWVAMNRSEKKDPD